MNFLLLLEAVHYVVFIAGEIGQKQGSRYSNNHYRDRFFEDLAVNELEIKRKIHCEESSNALQEGQNVTSKIFNVAKVKSRYYWQNFWQANYEPTWSCCFERRMGLRSDGGKWVCDPHKIFLKESCRVYSVGSDDQYDFERAVHDGGNHCEIHTFEIKANSTPVPSFINFHRVEISATGGVENKKTLYEIMDDLKHGEKVIDILKFDAEGAEYTVFTPLFFAELSKRGILVRQILIEVHNYPGKNEFVVLNIRRLFSTFKDHNYAIFHKEPNIIAGNDGTIVEFGLVRLPDALKCPG